MLNQKQIEVLNSFIIDQGLEKRRTVSFGLCGRLRQKFDSSAVDQWLHDAFDEWPECHVMKCGSKDLIHPVGGVEEYRIFGTVYTSEGLEKRKRLAQFLIDRVAVETSQ